MSDPFADAVNNVGTDVCNTICQNCSKSKFTQMAAGR